MQTCRRFAAVVIAGYALALVARATDFDVYQPDKTGETNCSELLTKALQDVLDTDRTLVVSRGTYAFAKPVYLPPNVELIGGPGLVEFKGTNRNVDILHTWRNSGNTIRHIAFTRCYKALTCEGSGFLSGSRIIDCRFTDCWAGIDFTSLQMTAIENCAFESCMYGIRGLHGSVGRSNGVKVNNCAFRRVGTWGIELEGGPTAVRDCLFEYSDGGGVRVADAPSAVVEGCYFNAVGIVSNQAVAVASEQLYSGIVSVRENQFMRCGRTDPVAVDGRARAHVANNFFSLGAGLDPVGDRSSAKGVTLADNALEGIPLSAGFTNALTSADAIVRAKLVGAPVAADRGLTFPKIVEGPAKGEVAGCAMVALTSYTAKLDVTQSLSGRAPIQAGATISVCFDIDPAESDRWLPADGQEAVFYLESLRNGKGYRAIMIESAK